MKSSESRIENEYEIVEEIEMAENMNIFPSKSEVATGGRPTRKNNPAAQEIKDYVTVLTNDPPSRKEDDEEALIRSGPEIRARRVSETAVDIPPGICAFLIKEHKELKQKQREQKMLEASRLRLEKANKKSRDRHGNQKTSSRTARAGRKGNTPLQEVSPKMEDKKTPSLRRVKSFGDLKGVESEADKKSKARGEEYMNRLHTQRQAIRDGKLEKVVPPSSALETKLNPNRQKASRKIAHSRSSSTSSKIGAYLGTSADLLDATRRDLASNLRKSVEKAEKVLSSKFDSLGRYSSGHGNDWDDDSDSDESFYCIGERRFSTIDRARRISGNGTDPWTEGTQEECRICRKQSPAGVRGLCLECEKEFRRPATAFFDGNGDEVKPPPPLKIKKAARGLETAQVKPGNIHISLADAEVKINQVQQRPNIIKPGSHVSRQVHIDNGFNAHDRESEYVSIYERWQTPELRTQYRSPEYDNTRWSPGLLDDDGVSNVQPSLRSRFNESEDSPAEADDAVPLLGQNGKQSEKSRSFKGEYRRESFYAYWDEVLIEDGKSIKSLKKRSSGYQKL